jgi:hypothetical protein
MTIRQIIFGSCAVLFLATALFLALQDRNFWPFLLIAFPLGINIQKTPRWWTYLLYVLYFVTIAVFAMKFYLASPVDWHQVLLTDWYVTALVICLPVMLLVWFAFEKRRELKAKSRS